MPRAERCAAAVDGAAELVGDYMDWLAVDGRGSRCYRDAAWAFLGRWPDPAGFAAEPLPTQLGLAHAQRPFLTYLMLHRRCRPSHDYLAHRKIPGLFAAAARSPLAPDVAQFTAAATELDYGGHVVKRAAERVVVRLLIQTGRPLSALTTTDVENLAAAFRGRAHQRGNASSWANDRGLIAAAHRVLFHLGVLPEPPADPRRRPGLDGHYSGVAEPLRELLLAYCAQAAATRAPATVKTIASHLAGFGRFLSACDPPVTDLAALDRTAHIEPWLAALAAARHPDGRSHSIGHRRGQILAVRQFLTDITEWGWPSAPARPLIFARDVPEVPRPLPRYLPPDADRRLHDALEQLSASGPSPLARLHADALLLARATGLRPGELRDLELDCVHEIDGHGAWLKVPLGKLGTERMVPLDAETVAVLDRIVARRTPGRALPHPHSGRPTEFLLIHQGRRLSAQAVRDELARTAQATGLDKVTPHALRHTYATALVNAGVSLQALMQLLGHVSATMSLRYGRLFDTTVRSEYERALTQAKAALATEPTHAPATTGTPLPAATGLGAPLPLVDITRGGDWRDTPTIKSRLAGGFCLRAPAQGSCPYANICEHCPNFRTDPGFLAVLGAQHADAAALAADAEARGWADEAHRHRRLADRLDELITHTSQTP
ncbi:tyrosine-type recombinase/integrase [Pseudonocardia nigra]|uniref:tyrosine-type recombinase/integrase n=1 Tax=Pseudonocardia nigra TaxID=1921578 RepID=UPI001C5ECFDB|nr:tyrosine-type recombinase/integrase [Pseudonocardia nigra]